MKKKAPARKKSAPKKGLVKKLAAKLSAAKKPARKKLAAKKIPKSLARPSQPAAPQAANAPAFRKGPLHLPSKPEPAYAVMHKRDWAHQPPPHEFRIPKR